MTDFTRIEQVKHEPGSPEDILGWLHAYRDYIDDETCSNMCDKTYEQQGCPSGTCSLQSARAKIRLTIATYEREVFGASSEEYWAAHEEASK
jgi:hypothetical protein